MAMTLNSTVFAQHVDEKWQKHFPTQSGGIVATHTFDGGDTFCATHDELGCGRNYSTRERAIIGLLKSCGYTAIRSYDA